MKRNYRVTFLNPRTADVDTLMSKGVSSKSFPDKKEAIAFMQEKETQGCATCLYTRRSGEWVAILPW